MIAERSFWCAVVCLLVLNISACSSAGGPMVEQRDPPPAANTGELEQLYWARQDSARMRFSDADVDFMTGMIAHHAQALVMSDLAPTNAASQDVKTLASRIINAQKDEIATMQKWLRDREQPVPEVHISGLTLMIHGVGEHHTHMPGMLTDDQLVELSEARGPEFDRLFLTYMIQHHSGAVSMVDDLFSVDGAGQDGMAFKLASDINVDQQTEIARMKRMLEQLTNGSRTP